MKKQIVSVVPMEFKDKITGKESVLYKCYLIADSGDVGFVYSSVEHKVGDSVELSLAVNKDGRFTAKIKEPVRSQA